MGDEQTAAGTVLIWKQVDGHNLPAFTQIGGQPKSAAAMGCPQIQAAASCVCGKRTKNFRIAPPALVQIAVIADSVKVRLKQLANMRKVKLVSQLLNGFDDAYV
jgi:hypothetical protein